MTKTAISKIKVDLPDVKDKFYVVTCEGQVKVTTSLIVNGEKINIMMLFLKMSRSVILYFRIITTMLYLRSRTPMYLPKQHVLY